MHRFFGIAFATLIGVGLLSIVAEFFMRARLTGHEFTRDKWLFWRLSGEDVAARYGETFPHSRMPVFRRSFFLAPHRMLCSSSRHNPVEIALISASSFISLC